MRHTTHTHARQLLSFMQLLIRIKLMASKLIREHNCACFVRTRQMRINHLFYSIDYIDLTSTPKFKQFILHKCELPNNFNGNLLVPDNYAMLITYHS